MKKNVIVILIDGGRVDFAKKSWAPGTGWPIPYGEIDKYYDKASTIFQIRGGDLLS